MKKWVNCLLVVALVLLFAGCTANSGGEEPTDGAAPNQWGVTLETRQVTPKGLTLVCRHSGGENVSELRTGSYYVIENSEAADWVDVEYARQEYEAVWTSVAWIIQKENTTAWDVSWEGLYGQLPAGTYRIGKQIMNFRGPGDFDEEMVYAEFVIE